MISNYQTPQNLTPDTQTPDTYKTEVFIMTINEPRIRAMLRQADKVAANGKLSAAEELYQEIIAEAPDSADAWAGLGEVSGNEAAQEEAFNKALDLDPDNRRALLGLAQLHGEEIDLPEDELDPEPNPKPESQPHPADEVIYDLVCYRHPNKETSLRCYTCGKPICIDCAKKTAVGYACPDCIRELEDKYFNSQTSDYIVAPLLAVVLGLISGAILTLIGSMIGGFFLFIILFFAGGAVGSFIGGIIKRAIGRRRGRYLPIIIAVITIAMTILPSLLLGGFNILAVGIFLFVAIPAIYYQMR